MAKLRDRRRRGYLCYMIEASDADVSNLIARGFLDQQQRDDPAAIETAIGAVLDAL
jgi:hypothetical protein